MRKNIVLNFQKQSISIKTIQPFQSIESVDIYSNIPLLGDGPKGLRYTLKNDSKTLDCFCWQTTNELSFNCFDILNQFSELNDKTLFNELQISCEGIDFSNSTKININLDIN
jgi:hypothetical protein